MTLEFTAAGSGSATLVLVHGFPLTSAMWESQLSALASGDWRVLAPDLPGFGRTPGAMTSMEAAADDIAALIDAQGADRIALAGFSMGGYVAFAFARKYAERLRALILIDTKAEPDTEEAKAGRHESARRARSEGARPIVDAMLPRLVAPSTYEGRPDVVQRIAEIAAGATAEGVAAALEAMAARPSSVDLLPRIDVPVLVVHGDDDQLMPLDGARAMAAQIPGAHLVVVPDAGHTTPIESPEAVNAAMREFLALL
jgi:pimeloyl-ACP methyl ester carboxylesterase